MTSFPVFDTRRWRKVCPQYEWVASGDGVVRAYSESGMSAEDFAEIDYEHSASFGHQKNRK